MKELDEHTHYSTNDLVKVVSELIKRFNKLEEAYARIQKTGGSEVGEGEDR